jgi:hypothetical protein
MLAWSFKVLFGAISFALIQLLRPDILAYKIRKTVNDPAIVRAIEHQGRLYDNSLTLKRQ